jgi:hypothetical protein
VIIKANFDELFTQVRREGERRLVFLDPEIDSSLVVQLTVLEPDAMWSRKYFFLGSEKGKKEYEDFMASNGPMLVLRGHARYTFLDMFKAMEQAFHWGCHSEKKQIATTRLLDYIEDLRRTSMSDCSKGWVCPRCGKSHAPWVHSCDCLVGPVDTSAVESKSKDVKEEFHSSQDLGEKVDE